MIATETFRRKKEEGKSENMTFGWVALQENLANLDDGQ